MEKGHKMGRRLAVIDTCDATLQSLKDGKVIATAETQLASVDISTEDIEIRGGVGGSRVTSINSEKDIEINLRDALFSLDYLSVVSGTDIKEMEAVLPLNVVAKVNSEGKLEVTDEEVTKGHVTTEEGLQIEVDIVAGVVDVDTETVLPGLEEGDSVQMLIEKTVSGEGIEIRADKFPEKYKLTLRTMAYDPSTNEHIADLVFVYDEVQASGNLNLSFEMSTPIAPELTFQANKPSGCQSLGRVITIPPNSTEIDC